MKLSLQKYKNCVRPLDAATHLLGQYKSVQCPMCG